MIKNIFRSQPNFSYPLMRDPKRNPKCYEMTEEERLDAALRVDQLLKHKDFKNLQQVNR